MHLHGHDMYILSQGPGEWDGSTVVNPHNPLRRDVQMLDPFNHLVIQIDANNPGVWAYHCHIAWHLSMVSKLNIDALPENSKEELILFQQGMYVNILYGADQVTQWQIPYVMQQTCVDWDKWSSKHVVLEIDDGV